MESHDTKKAMMHMRRAQELLGFGNDDKLQGSVPEKKTTVKCP